MKREQIKVIIVEQGKEPRVETIKNELHIKQMLVGGYIEYHEIPDTNFGLYFNEEGKLSSEPEPTLSLVSMNGFYDVLCGNYIVVNNETDKDGNERDITDEQIAEFMQYYKDMKIEKGSWTYDIYKKQIKQMFN
jgi:hypothetical protein